MKYWIFVANDDEWDWKTNQKIGEVEPWSAYGDGKRRRKKYFLKVQEGDKVIGYSSGKSKSFVSIGVIEKSLSQDPAYRSLLCFALGKSSAFVVNKSKSPDLHICRALFLA